MLTMYRYDTDYGAVIEHADDVQEFLSDDWEQLHAIFFTWARLPFRYEVQFRISVTEITEWRPVVRVIDEHSSGAFYVCYVEDCSDPPMYLVRGDDWTDAYENFLCDPKIEAQLLVDEPKWDDCGTDYNDNGTYVCTEGVQCHGPLGFDAVRLRGA